MVDWICCTDPHSASRNSEAHFIDTKACPQHLTLAANRAFGLVCFHEFVDGVYVLSLLPANQAVAFANISRSSWT